MSSIKNSLRDRLQAAQKHLRLTGTQLAAGLRITPEWLSRIYTGKAEGSSDLELRLDAFLTQKGIDPRSILEIEPTSIAEDSPQAPYGTAQTLRAEAYELMDEVLEAAGDDLTRIGWVIVQLKTHLAIPAPWVTTPAAKIPGRKKGKFGRVLDPAALVPHSSETGLPLQGPLPRSRSA